MNRLVIILLFFLPLALLSGCGKRPITIDAPEETDGTPAKTDGFPRSYPDINTDPPAP